MQTSLRWNDVNIARGFPLAIIVSSEGITTGDWARFSNADLGLGPGFNGTSTWCKERWGMGSERLTRGSIDVSNTQRYSPTASNIYAGRRPVLELVE